MKTILRRYLQVQLHDITDTHYQYTVHGTDFTEDFDIRRNQKDTNSGKTRMMDFIAEKMAQFEEDMSIAAKEISNKSGDLLPDLCNYGCNPEKCTCIVTCPECHNLYKSKS